MAGNIKNNKLGGSDFGELYEADYEDFNTTFDKVADLIYEARRSYGIGNAENAVRILQSNNVFTNGPNLVTDEFTDEDGVNNTVNISKSSADYNSSEDKYEIESIPQNFVIIEADNLNESSFEINDCKIRRIDDRKWQLYSTIGTEEVKRAKIYQTLFYDKAAQTINNCTAIKTTFTRDIGKTAYFLYLEVNTSTGQTQDYTIDFQNETTNNNVSFWGRYFANDGSSGTSSVLQVPDGNTIRGGGFFVDINDLGTDRTQDEKDNPVDARLFTGVNDGNALAELIFLSKGDITFTYSGSGSNNKIEYESDEGIPAFTEATETIEFIVLVDSNTTNLDENEKGFAISTPDVELPTDTSIDVSISDGNNTIGPETIDTTSKGVIIDNDGTLTSGTLELTFTLKTTDNSKTPILKNYGVDIIR